MTAVYTGLLLSPLGGTVRGGEFVTSLSLKIYTNIS